MVVDYFVAVLGEEYRHMGYALPPVFFFWQYLRLFFLCA
jgi:hypothetical protein